MNPFFTPSALLSLATLFGGTIATVFFLTLPVEVKLVGVLFFIRADDFWPRLKS